MKPTVLLAFVLIIRCGRVKSGTISNVNSAFEVFSPKSMIRFFEFNDMGWTLSTECIKNMYSYLDGLQKDMKWAYKLLDASGNYAGGFYYGQHFRPANPNQCYQLNEELNFAIARNDIPGGLGNASAVVPFFVQLISAKFVTYVDNWKREIHQTVCLPVSCSYDDLIQVMSFTSFNPEIQLMKDTELTEIRILYQSYKFYLDVNFVVIAAIASAMLAVNVGISVYACLYRTKMRSMKNENFRRNIACNRVEDVEIPHCEHKTAEISGVDDVNLNDVKLCRNKTAKFKMSDTADTLTITNKNCHHLNLVKLKKNKVDNTITLDIITLNCGSSKHRKRRHENQFSETHPNVFKFSFLHQLSVSTPADTPHDVIDENNAIHGIRVLSLFWIILLNVTTIVSYASNNLKYVEEKNSNWLIYLIFKNGSFSIDSYFFVSGILLCQMFFNSSRDLKINRKSGISKHFQHFFLVVAYKFLRTLVPYVLVISSLRIAMKHFNENSILSVPSNDHITCDNIWKNVLFLDNFTPYEERCSLWTWYISLEFQFFVISLLVLMVSRNSKRFALVIFLAFFTSTFFTTTAMGVQSSKITQISNFTHEQRLMHFNGIYDHPLSHLGPYLVGIFFGFFAFNYDKKVKIHPVLVATGWITSGVLFLLLMLSSFNMDGVDPWVRQGFSTISHTFWSMILLWICFALSSGYGGFLNDLFSSHFLQVISKVSNTVMLIHPLLTRVFILGSNNAVFVSVQLIAIAFFGFAIISFLFGVFFYVSFEGPVLAVLHTVYDKLAAKSRSNIPC